jgi:hypothetical protein
MKSLLKTLLFLFLVLPKSLWSQDLPLQYSIEEITFGHKILFKKTLNFKNLHGFKTNFPYNEERKKLYPHLKGNVVESYFIYFSQGKIINKNLTQKQDHYYCRLILTLGNESIPTINSGDLFLITGHRQSNITRNFSITTHQHHEKILSLYCGDNSFQVEILTHQPYGSRFSRNARRAGLRNLNNRQVRGAIRREVPRDIGSNFDLMAYNARRNFLRINRDFFTRTITLEDIYFETLNIFDFHQ